MRILLVVGPSGAGKDTLLRSARLHFGTGGKVGFIRRYITRPPDTNEDNYYIDTTGFQALENTGFFVSTWQAHDHRYGVPAHAVHNTNGFELLICSVSRTVITDFEGLPGTVKTLQITAPEPILRQRLQQRGRETPGQIHARIQRARQPLTAKNLITFNNSQPLEKSQQSFLRLLASL